MSDADRREAIRLRNEAFALLDWLTWCADHGLDVNDSWPIELMRQESNDEPT